MENGQRLRANRKHRPASDAYGRCIEGVIYYLAKANYGTVVMSFDVRSEKFDMIGVPPKYCRKLVTYKGWLACFDAWDDRRFWILEDAQKQIWSVEQELLSPSADFGRGFKLTGSTHAGEFIYVPKRDSRLFYVLLCDPVRNSWRRFEFEMSVRNEEIHRTYALYAFPNHIDSQISL
ncbi:putative F-box protein [Raphanus sativus]|uniref:F-box protein At1g47790 n=1 Tax=Raphanus sativus TaxID=3726 RepID=A0A9W3BVT3_RAPSA|nr:putative F-box protein At1g47790 [Raphanus sativus]KAJ4885970.1 putative F-box protein [Raphanus sativus]